MIAATARDVRLLGFSFGVDKLRAHPNWMKMITVIHRCHKWEHHIFVPTIGKMGQEKIQEYGCCLTDTSYGESD